MWKSQTTKTCKAVKRWHSKSWLVDPKKTRITMIYAEPAEIVESAENPGIIAPNLDVATGAPDLSKNLGTGELDLQPEETEALEAIPKSAPTETSSGAIDASRTENFQSIEPATEETMEIMDPEVSEVTSPQELTHNVKMETQIHMETTDMQCSIGNIGIANESLDEPTYANESADPSDTTEALNRKFLVALKRASLVCGNDKQLGKIITKMEKGKNLKKKERTKVYFLLRERISAFEEISP